MQTIALGGGLSRLPGRLQGARAARRQAAGPARRLLVPRGSAGRSGSSIEEQPLSDRLKLELLFAAAPDAPAGPLALAAQQQNPGGAGRRGATHTAEVCGHSGGGMHLCVEHTIDEAGEDLGAAPAEAPEPGPAGLLGRLLDLIPLSKRSRGIVMLNLLVLLVATNWVVVKDVGASFDPYGFAFLRFGVAALAFSPFLKAASKDRRILEAGVEIGVWTAAGYIFQSAGLLTTDASRASFLSTFTVLVVPLLAGLSGRGVSLVTWASCFAALAGVGLLEQGGAPPGIGDLWSMLSAVAFGLQVFRTEHHARILGNGHNLSLMSVVLTTTMVFAGLAAGAMHPSALMDWMQHPADLEHMFAAGHFPWQQVLYTGLLTTDLALLMEVLALQDVSSVEAAIIYTLEPVLGAGFAWMLLGERLGAKGLAGAAIILASSLVTQIGSSGGGGDGGDQQQQQLAEEKAE